MCLRQLPFFPLLLLLLALVRSSFASVKLPDPSLDSSEFRAACALWVSQVTGENSEAVGLELFRRSARVAHRIWGGKTPSVPIYDWMNRAIEEENPFLAQQIVHVAIQQQLDSTYLGKYDVKSNREIALHLDGKTRVPGVLIALFPRPADQDKIAAFWSNECYAHWPRIVVTNTDFPVVSERLAAETSRIFFSLSGAIPRDSLRLKNDDAATDILIFGNADFVVDALNDSLSHLSDKPVRARPYEPLCYRFQ